MRSLLKAELFRLKNERSLQVVFYIAIGFGFLSVAFLQIFSSSQNGYIYDLTEKLANSFSLSNDVGLILSIVILIVSCREYTYGTIRNKMIAGHSRTAIFYSKLFALLISCILIMLTYALSLYLFGLMFPKKLHLPSFAMLLKMILIGLLNIILSFTFLHVIVMLMKNIGACIALYLGIGILLSLVGSILLTNLVLWQSSPEKLISILSWIPTFQMTFLITEEVRFVPLLLKTLISCLGLSSILVLLGNYFFNKKDIK